MSKQQVAHSIQYIEYVNMYIDVSNKMLWIATST